MSYSHRKGSDEDVHVYVLLPEPLQKKYGEEASILFGGYIKRIYLPNVYKDNFFPCKDGRCVLLNHEDYFSFHPSKFSFPLEYKTLNPWDEIRKQRKLLKKLFKKHTLDEAEIAMNFPVCADLDSSEERIYCVKFILLFNELIRSYAPMLWTSYIKEQFETGVWG